MKKVAFYGGTFDPPHIGHVSAARAFAGYTGADMLYIIPNYIPPLKDGCRPASADDRLAMASLAFGGEKTVISDYEIKNGGVSYTFMTAEHLASLHPGAQLFMLVGTDQLLQLEKWKEPRRLLETVTVCVALRAAEEERAAREKADRLHCVFGARVLFVPCDPVTVSSTEIRALLREGRGAEYLPEAVYEYIIEKGLYR